MRLAMKLHSTAIFLAALLAQSPLAIAESATKITWDDHIFALMEGACISCHNPDKTKGGLDLSSYNNLLKGGSSGESVTAGDPESSLLYKVTAHLEEPFMPQNKDRLPDAQIALLKSWISGGLLETASSKAKKAKSSGFNLALKVTNSGKPEGPPPMPEHLPLQPHVLSERPAAVSALATSPWAPLAAVAGQKQALLYNTDTFEPVAILPYEEGFIESLKFSPNGALLVAGGGRGGKVGRVIAWDVKTGQQVLKVGQEYDTVLSADITADQATVAIGSPSKRIKLHDTADGELLHNIKKHSEWVTSVSFSPDGVLLATGDRNGGVHVWEAFSGNLFYTLEGNKGAITSITWRSDSNIVATASADGSVRLFAMTNGRQVRNWTAHGGGVLSLHFARNGQLVSSGRDKQVKVWAQDGKQIKALGGFTDLPLEVAFTQDAKRVIVGDWLGSVTVWDIETAKQVATLSANPPSLNNRLAAAQQQVVAADAAEKKAKSVLDAAKAVTAQLAKQLTDARSALAARTTEKQQADTALAASKQQQSAATSARTAASNNLKTQQDKLSQINAVLKTESDKLTANKANLSTWKAQVTARTSQSESLKTAADNANAESAKIPEDAALKDAASKAVAAWQAMDKALSEARSKENTAATNVQNSEFQVTTARKQSETQASAVKAGQNDLATKDQALKVATAKVTADAKASAEKVAQLKVAQDAVSKSEAAHKAQVEKEKAPAQAHSTSVAKLAAAQKKVAKWKAEQLNVNRHLEIASLNNLDSELVVLKSASADTKATFEKAEADLLAVQNQLTEAPTRIKEAEVSLSGRKSTVTAEAQKLGTLNEDVSRREAFLKKADAFGSEIDSIQSKEPQNAELADASKNFKEQVRSKFQSDLDNAKGRVAAQQQVLAQANEAVVAAERHLVEMKTLPEKLPAIIAERTKIRDLAKSAYESAQASEIQFTQKVDAQRKKVDGLTGQYLALLPK